MLFEINLKSFKQPSKFESYIGAIIFSAFFSKISLEVSGA